MKAANARQRMSMLPSTASHAPYPQVVVCCDVGRQVVVGRVRPRPAQHLESSQLQQVVESGRGA